MKWGSLLSSLRLLRKDYQRAGIPDDPDEAQAKAAFMAVRARIDLADAAICCPHAGDNKPDKWALQDCTLICLGAHYLALCPVCWDVVRANVYDSIVEKYGRAGRPTRRA